MNSYFKAKLYLFDKNFNKKKNNNIRQFFKRYIYILKKIAKKRKLHLIDTIYH